MKKANCYKFFYLHIKNEWSELLLYQQNRAVILNRAKDYYRNNKNVLRDKAKNKYRKLSEEEKNIKREYRRNRYHNMSEEKKQKLKNTKNIFA